MNEEQVRQIIKEEIKDLVDKRTAYERLASDRIVYQKSIQLKDGSKIYIGGVNGLKMGTASTEKIGFYGVDPIVQPSTIAEPSGGVVEDSQARNAIDSIIQALIDLGLIASS